MYEWTQEKMTDVFIYHPKYRQCIALNAAYYSVRTIGNYTLQAK